MTQPELFSFQVGGDGDGDTTSLQAALLRPSGTAPYPTVMWWSGGGWTSMGIGGGVDRVGWLTQLGWAVMLCEYRVAQPGAAQPNHFPIPLQDVLSGIRWLQHQSTDLGLNAQRLVLCGDSAGGHLVSLAGSALGSYPGDGDVAGVMALMPATDLRLSTVPYAHCIVDLLGGSPESRPELAAQASPLCQVHADMPRHLIVHGGADSLVPIAQSEALAAALAQAEVPVTTLWLPEVGHNQEVYDHPESRQEMASFLMQISK